MHGSVGQFVRRRRCAERTARRSSRPRRSGIRAKRRRAMLGWTKPENVRVIFRRGSGCYGLNGADTVTYDAALLSQAVGKTGARAADAQGRDGLGELRQRVRDRPARGARRQRQHHRVGSRVVVAWRWQPARVPDCRATSSPDAAGFSRAAFAPRSAPRRPRSTTAATRCRLTSPGASAESPAAPAP